MRIIFLAFFILLPVLISQNALARPFETFDQNVARVEKQRFDEDLKKILQSPPSKCLLGVYIGCMIEKLNLIEVKNAASMKVLIDMANTLAAKDRAPKSKFLNDPTYLVYWSDALTMVAEKTTINSLWLSRYKPEIPSDKIAFEQFKGLVLRQLVIQKKDLSLVINKYILDYNTRIEGYNGSMLLTRKDANAKVKSVIDRINYVVMSQ